MSQKGAYSAIEIDDDEVLFRQSSAQLKSIFSQDQMCQEPQATIRPMEMEARWTKSNIRRGPVQDVPSPPFCGGKTRQLVMRI